MKIQFVIMAHISRLNYAEALKKQIDAQSMSIDRGELGLVDAHIQAWGMADGISDYVFVLQDDVLLTDNFLEKSQYHVENCVEKYGRQPIHFYLRNTPRVRIQVQCCKQNGRDHLTLNNLHSGNSIGLPQEHIKPMLQYFKRQSVESGDQRINGYIRDNGLIVYFPMPNLCEHRNLPSLHDGNSSPMETRTSVWFE